MKVITDNPFCVGSADFLHPVGAVNDDSTNLKYIESIEKYFNNKKISSLELGCAGGRVVLDLVRRGHDSYGLEGTPYPRLLGRPAWTELYNRHLFNCDLSKPFNLLDDNNEDYKFDLVSHWEFMEHLPTESLKYLHGKMYLHLKDEGAIFCGICPWGPSTDISQLPEGHPDKSAKKHQAYIDDANQRGYVLHLSCFFRHQWEENYFSDLFETFDYSLEGKLRDDETSFNCILKKKIGKKYIDLAKKYTMET